MVGGRAANASTTWLPGGPSSEEVTVLAAEAPPSARLDAPLLNVPAWGDAEGLGASPKPLHSLAVSRVAETVPGGSWPPVLLLSNDAEVNCKKLSLPRSNFHGTFSQTTKHIQQTI